MPQTVSVATFNCENLFSRPKIFRQDKTKANELLGYVAQLQAELSEPVFDQAKIKALKSKLKGYVEVNDVRKKHDKAAGAAAWVGWLEFTRGTANITAIDNTAHLIADVNADVICLVEVESRPTLRLFHDGVLCRKPPAGQGCVPYEHIVLMDGNDERGIDVAVMSRFPVQQIRTHVAETTTYLGSEVPLFSRDCLEVFVTLPDGSTLVMMANHFKSMGYSDKQDPQSVIRRTAQSQRVSELATERIAEGHHVVVAGDLNSDPADASIAPLVANTKLYNPNEKLPADQRGTYHTGKKQLDYLWLSPGLRKSLQSVEIMRQGLYSKKWDHYPKVTSDLTQASDHCPVKATIALK